MATDVKAPVRATAATGTAGSTAFLALVRERSCFTWGLTLGALAIYFGFILLVAFQRDFLARPIGDGTTTIGIP